MGIWKCANGGVHSGNDCHEDFGKYLAHPRKDWHDARLVILPSIHDLYVDLMDVDGITPAIIATVLTRLEQRTPSALDDKDWKKIHDPSA
jgi:hypothetical protein